jgi:ABC-type uncharacterized transport system permease subunit
MTDNALVLTLAAAVAAGTPLVLAGLGELLTERSGILNLGVEGMMLMGAISAFLVTHAADNVWLGLAVGCIAGAGMATIHAFLSVTLRADQIVSGLGLVILAIGLSSFIGQPVEGVVLSARIQRMAVPLLSELPAVGRVLFQQDVITYASWLVVAAASFYLARSRPGLSLRAVGESPAAADAVGIRVAAFRYVHTILGGVLAGAGGAYIVLARVPNWSEAATTNGIGWIAIALVIFAGWRPAGVLVGAYLFGAALRANFALQAAGVRAIPAEFLSMLPYLLTILVLIAFSASRVRRRVGAPEALGAPYMREEER